MSHVTPQQYSLLQTFYRGIVGANARVLNGRAVSQSAPEVEAGMLTFVRSDFKDKRNLSICKYPGYEGNKLKLY